MAFWKPGMFAPPSSLVLGTTHIPCFFKMPPLFFCFLPRGKKGGISCSCKAQGPPLGGTHLLLLLLLRVYAKLHFWSFGINCALLNYRKEKHVQMKSIGGKERFCLKVVWSFEYTCQKSGPTLKWIVVFFTSNIHLPWLFLDCVGPPYLDQEEH
jgi:hypothetical protein